ncbi:hypothetical protein GCM10022382_18940 [Microbacterium invictum]
MCWGLAGSIALSALGLIVVVNPLTEYMLGSGFPAGQASVLPGAGYAMSAAFILAGIVLTTSATATLLAMDAGVAPVARAHAPWAISTAVR